MPIITVSLFSGRTQREKDRLAESITESVCKILEVDKKEVIVLFQEAPSGNCLDQSKKKPGSDPGLLYYEARS